MKGCFITLEGGEGSGKSTQVKLLCDAFAKAGLPYIATREPGGTESAERIRTLLVTGDKDAWLSTTETLLFYAARLEHVERRIRPALDSGTHVICDRFADSTRVYQGLGKNLPGDFIEALHHLTIGNFAPDLTLILNIDPEEGLKRARAQSHNEKRFEAESLDFHRRIHAGFLSIAEREPGRCAVIDAGTDKNAVHQQIITAIKDRLGIAC